MICSLATTAVFMSSHEDEANAVVVDIKRWTEYIQSYLHVGVNAYANFDQLSLIKAIIATRGTPLRVSIAPGVSHQGSLLKSGRCPQSVIVP